MKLAPSVLLALTLLAIPYLQNFKHVENLTPIVAQNHQLYSARLYPQGAKIADRFYWLEGKGNLGITIFGKFNSAHKMAETFNLSQEIGSFNNRKWILRDILLTVDYGGNGNVAQWQVSGPKPLIQKYINDLKAQYANKSVFYNLSYFTAKFTVSHG